MATVLIFPGQGSQRPGMGAPWRASPGWELVERASDLLGRDLEWLLLQADAEQLLPTREAQLATFLTCLLAWRALPSGDVVAVAGHSLGELTALVVAGILTEDQGLRLVAERGEAMQAAADASPGTMAAVLGLEPELVRQVCDSVRSGAPVGDPPAGVWPANDNAPGHVVISGTVEGVAAAAGPLRRAGARRVLPLPVGGAFHTPLMAPARARFDAALAAATYAGGLFPVIANTTAQAYDDDVAGHLSRQLTAPVRWRESLLALPPVDTVIEVGPGRVLTGLVKRTLPLVRAVAFASPTDLTHTALETC